MCQALAAGYERVFCTAEVEEARALRDARGEGVLGGERRAVRIPGFDLGNSPREYEEPAGETLILSTTNGTRAVVAAVPRIEERAEPHGERARARAGHPVLRARGRPRRRAPARRAARRRRRDRALAHDPRYDLAVVRAHVQ